MSREEVVTMMAGGEEMDKLSAELEEFERSDAEEARRSAVGGADDSSLAEAFRKEIERLRDEEEPER